MKNPLNKRYFRELKNDFGKYIALCLFLIVTIGFCSGFLVADGSTKGAYDESFEKYNIEDGHFILAKEAEENQMGVRYLNSRIQELLDEQMFLDSEKEEYLLEA